MKHTFFLRDPKTSKRSLILFTCFFKNEAKKFVYSTGESIETKYWNKEEKRPNTVGKSISPVMNSILTQLNRYSEEFNKVRSRLMMMDEEFTSQSLRLAFDKEFRKTNPGKNKFFHAYDMYIEEKMKEKEWKLSTLKRYNNIRNILLDFEKERSFKLTFSNITEEFYTEFVDYSLEDKQHINNTFSRNLGLLKAFLNWSVDKGYTYNLKYRKFKKKKLVITNQVALTISDLRKLLSLEFESTRLEKVRDIFIFACVTGMRFGELRLISKRNIEGDSLLLKEEKSTEKEQRNIPLNSMAMYILRKYDFELPLIANQKFNVYIKEVFKEAGYNQEVEKSVARGKETIRDRMLYYERINSHTARRTFITLMKEEGMSDKLISKITGHKDMKTLNQYYQVSDKKKKEAVEKVFPLKAPLKKVE